jgi:hypothetical protein
MAIEPERLHRVVWVKLPAALYFGLRAVQALTHGAMWSGVAFVVIMGLVASAPLVSNRGALRGWRAVLYGTLLATGVAGWIVGHYQTVRVAGFVLVVVVQVAVILASRRLPMGAEQAMGG